VINSTGWTIKPAVNHHKLITGLAASTEYVWQVKTVCDLATNITSDWSDPAAFTTAPLKLIDESISLELFEIYPNPFSVQSTIHFYLRGNSDLTIDLFDLSGRKIKTIADGNYETGHHQLFLDATNLNASIYVLHFILANQTSFLKIIKQ
jgi:hypothetical protein